MAEIVGGVGVPHTPHFPGIVDRGEPLAPELRRLYGAAARHLRDLAPDFLIFFTCDHYNIFFVESVPIFSIGVAPSAPGPSDYRELQAYTVPIASGLARHVQAEAVRGGFDVGMSQEFEFDHPVTVPLHFLTPQMDVPIVPVFVNGLIPPLPSAARCHALGAMIRETLTGMGGSARSPAGASRWRSGVPGSVRPPTPGSPIRAGPTGSWISCGPGRWPRWSPRPARSSSRTRATRPASC